MRVIGGLADFAVMVVMGGWRAPLRLRAAIAALVFAATVLRGAALGPCDARADAQCAPAGCSASNSTLCEACAGGFYLSATAAGLCVPCAAGFACAAGTPESASAAVPCITDGYWCPVGSAVMTQAACAVSVR